MKNFKDLLADWIEREGNVLASMSDRIFDHPEPAYHEEYASGLLEDYLEAQGFAVERGLGSLKTAFRAVWTSGTGGLRIGLLCEYDALPNGHSCGHQMQGPTIAGAAAAIKALLPGNYTLVVYGTPAEEGAGGKVTMLEEGYLQDLDVALMMHGGPATQTDVRSMAKISATVTFYGKSAHAALKPEDGISALDALLLSFQGIEFLREHVKEDSRMHYTIKNAGGSANVVPAEASGEFALRSYDSAYLDYLILRFEQIIQGAALMAGATSEIQYHRRYEGKIPARRLNQLLMEQAEYFHAPNCQPPREKTGSTDFANVMYRIPGSCIRVAFVAPGTSSHSQEFLDAGKTPAAHDAVIYAGKILAAAVCELVEQPGLMKEIRQEFEKEKSRH